MKKTLLYSSILIVSGIILTGCGKGPEVPALIEAKDMFTQIQSDVKINKNAPLALYEAKKLYQKSDSIENERQANHLAYLLKREVEITKETAQRKESELKIQKLKELKNKVILDSRQVELSAKIHEAEEAKKQALLLKKQAEAAKQRLKELEELHAKETNRGLVLTLGDVLFATNKANLLPGAMRAIEKLTEFLEANPQRNVLIEGHTDSRGSEAYNLNLSNKRAESVAGALQNKGLDSFRITTKGYGEAYPITTNQTAEGRQQNRRVEIVILKEGADAQSIIR